MPDRCAFDYAIVRIVPRVEREEFLNAGVIVYCRELRFLGARVWLDASRLAALAPEADPEVIQAGLTLIPRICAGGPDSGRLGQLSQVERFRWLTAPHSTMIQTSPVHPGLCADPAAALAALAAQILGA
jgi:hypothetical protein